MPLENSEFPAFSLKDQHSSVWTDKDFKGKWTVLYAYPKDMTSGCTTEAHDFTRLHKQFEKLNAQVLGLSPDDIDSHTKFCDKDNITFPLLSDPDKSLLTALHIWIEKSMYGKKYFGVNRSTWIIDEDGIVVKEWNKVKVPGHAEEVLNTLETLQTASPQDNE